MFNTFTTERVLFNMLLESQDPGADLPFHLTDTVKLYNYNPGDCRVVPFLPEDGMYIFFKKAILDNNDPAEQHALPDFTVFVYASRGASDKETSPEAAHAAAENAVHSLYECLSHTMARRLLMERVQAVEGMDSGYRIARLRVHSAENVATYPIAEQGVKTVVFWEVQGTFGAQETPGQNEGVPILGVDTELVATRDKDVVPTPAEVAP